MPKYQVMKFQAIAPANAATITACVDALGSIIPLPTVLATAVPERAPAKLSTAAMRIAWRGESTRVATTVAIELAVSWKPLVKLNTMARIMTTPRRMSESPILQHDRLQ